MFRFVIDRRIRNRAYPNLALHPAEPYTQSWREFGQHYPYTVTSELVNHCEQHGYPFELTTTREYINSNALCTNSSEIVNNALHYYPVEFGWFSHDTDYVSLLPPEVKNILRNNRHDLRILFYYHEGDNPLRIKQRLDQLCEQNGLSASVYRLVTGNTAANAVEQGYYFNDHELLYYMQNKEIRAKSPEFLKTGVPMKRRFLSVSRSHK
jgi:hypothetical protein